MTPETSPSIETYSHAGDGYLPLVFSADWQVAVLNWESGMENAVRLKTVERHLCTDEVFVLVRGRAALITLSAPVFTITDLQAGLIYNVKSGVWHTLLASRDASMIIVEKRDTHQHDVETRALDEQEIERIITDLNIFWEGGSGDISCA